MKQSILTLLCLLLIGCSGNAPLKKELVKQATEESPVVYFNAFQNSANVDSSLYFARKLASDPKNAVLLQELLHNSFAQEFTNHPQTINDPSKRDKLSKRLKWSKLLLSRMATDSNNRLAQSVSPIYYWVKVQDSEDNINTQRQITNQFIKEELSHSDLYENRVGRYALLIHQIISKEEKLNGLSKLLIDRTTAFLSANQVNTSVESSSNNVLDKRAWYRYLYAYSNNLQAKALVSNGKGKQAEKFYQTSFEFSPDLIDLDHETAYFYDLILLTGADKIPFQEEYLAYVQRGNQDKSKVLNTLLDITLLNPQHKERLRKFYNANFQGREKFGSFWRKSINAGLKESHSFSLSQIDGLKFSTGANRGKWILIDFWGTWCAPCRKEHPDLQKFYGDVIANKNRNVSVITIACKDKKSFVESYMLDNKYTFPVAIADSKIEKTYNIQSYPTKILVTPEGKFILIPFGIDWVSFIKSYSTL
jgi:thiol-disulfide isomerase/thioredoxin